jgi:hypothetical protein
MISVKLEYAKNSRELEQLCSYISLQLLDETSIQHFEQSSKNIEQGIEYHIKIGKSNELLDILEVINPYWIMFDSNHTFQNLCKRNFFSLDIREDFFCLREISRTYNFYDGEKEVVIAKKEEEGVVNIPLFDQTNHSLEEFTYNNLYSSFEHLLKKKDSITNYICKISLYISYRSINILFLLTKMFKNVYINKPIVSDWLQPFVYVVLDNRDFNANVNISDSQNENMVSLSFLNLLSEFSVLCFKTILNKFNQINHLLKYKRHTNNSNNNNNNSSSNNEEDNELNTEAYAICKAWCISQGLEDDLKYINTKSKDTTCKWERNKS